jgi:hypothetical protein
MARYEYRFNIPVSPGTKREVIGRVTELFGALRSDFPELAPHWFTARSKTKAKPYSPGELEKAFARKTVVGLFTSMTESDSCSITLQYMPEINGCFVVSMMLPLSADMSDTAASAGYERFFDSAKAKLLPDNAYLRTIDTY